MRWTLCVGLTLSLAACRQTVVLDQSAYDGGGRGGSGGIDAGFDGRFDGPPLCPGMPIMITPESPRVMVVLDRSEGMTSRFADNTTPLAAAREALDEYATRYQSVIWFGYSDLPGANTSCGMQGCCLGNFTPPAMKLQTFSYALHACDLDLTCASPTGNQRPTQQALTSISTFTFNDQYDPRGRYILLITNGRPDCSPSGPGSCNDGGNTVSQINQLQSKEVYTYVVAPGQIDPETMQCLRDMAVAGGTVSQPSYFHASQDPLDLNGEIGDHLRTIARDACTLDLQGTRIDQMDDPGLVWKDMTQVPRGGNSGWDVTGNGYSITLRGQWCDHLIDDGPAAFKLFASCSTRR